MPSAFAAEPGEVGVGGAGLGNGVAVRIVTRLQPPGKNTEALRLSNRYGVGKGILHRFMVDVVNRTFFGYDLSAEPLAGTIQCRVAISPLTSVQMDESSGALPRGSAGASAGGGVHAFPLDSSFRAVLLPKYPDPQVVSSGDTIVLELLSSPDGNQKLVDFIEVTCRPPRANPDTHAARDFSLEDVEMHVSKPVMRVNGEAVSGAKVASVRGKLIWFYFPGHGRFILSAVPRPREGFMQSGVIRGYVAAFQFGSNQYEVRSAFPILGSDGTWNVYLLHQPAYRGSSSPAFGSAARLAELFSHP